jgi:hypothetical protein
MAVQEVIIYRSPLDKVMWDAYNDSIVGTVFAWICGLAAIGLALVVIFVVIKAMIPQRRQPYGWERGNRGRSSLGDL